MYIYVYIKRYSTRRIQYPKDWDRDPRLDIRLVECNISYILLYAHTLSSDFFEANLHVLVVMIVACLFVCSFVCMFVCMFVLLPLHSRALFLITFFA